MSDTQAPARIAYLRFIDDGLTFEGQVWRAGAVTATTDLAIANLEPLEQRRLWGVVHFEVIPEEEYLALRDIPAQNLRATRRVSMTPSPPATAYSANGEPQNYDQGKAAPIAMAPAQLMTPPMLTDSSEKAAKYGIEQLNAGLDTPPPPEPGNVANMPVPEHVAPQWDWYDGSTDIQTISQIATMGEATIQEFLNHERTHRNRPHIIKLIETGEL